MHTRSTFLTLRVITSLHAGAGSDNGLVDLPIQREVVTGYPKIEASTLKGALRSRLEQLGACPLKIHLAFGYDERSDYEVNESFSDDGDANSYAQFFTGALTFTDARLLAFPVRSMKGVFALTTCPYVLRRLAEDAELLAGIALGDALKSVKVEDDKCLGDSNSPLIFLNDKKRVILEEYPFEHTPIPSEVISALSRLIPGDLTRLVILSDDVFADFTQLFTERVTRNAIDDKTGTVKEGALFTEEYLPPETLLYSIVLADKPRQPEAQGDDQHQGSQRKALPNDFNTAEDVLKFFKTEGWKGQTRRFLQLGANASIGKGIVELLFNEEKQ
ncbi:MAG: type III-B CRISPR module RAMP protein Cmr4 [Saprospiraceae bacterium]|nr:type III-B CRISPR module RAMP protein Cmr4 [Saprospiraceae bacterium]MDW8485087.1 type III-B CRISPR module RAMP protein Cmr4 [Saprospiraceae bacterium]